MFIYADIASYYSNHYFCIQTIHHLLYIFDDDSTTTTPVTIQTTIQYICIYFDGSDHFEFLKLPSLFILFNVLVNVQVI